MHGIFGTKGTVRLRSLTAWDKLVQVSDESGDVGAVPKCLAYMSMTVAGVVFDCVGAM